MTLYLNTIVHADALTFLRGLPDKCVQTCVTSPPYFGLRDYGVVGQIGMEAAPAEYVAAIVNVFREVWRVLCDDGTLWLNLGDSYASSGKGGQSKRNRSANWQPTCSNKGVTYSLPPKSRMMIPARVAIALQDDGWVLRDEIVWSKPSVMPESVTDRTTKAHEMIYMLAKQSRYYYDAAAIAEPAQDWGSRDRSNGKYTSGIVPISGGKHHSLTGGNFSKKYAAAQPHHGGESHRKPYLTRNKRSVWTINAEPFKGAHFATFPPALITPCILAGSPIGSVVLDPFMGSGTTALVARYHGRQYIGCELNAEYITIAQERLRLPFEPRHTPVNDDVSDLPMFAAHTD